MWSVPKPIGWDELEQRLIQDNVDKEINYQIQKEKDQEERRREEEEETKEKEQQEQEKEEEEKREQVRRAEDEMKQQAWSAEADDDNDATPPSGSPAIPPSLSFRSTMSSDAMQSATTAVTRVKESSFYALRWLRTKVLTPWIHHYIFNEYE